MSAMLKNIITTVVLLTGALTLVVAEDGLVYAVIGGQVTFEPRKFSGELKRIAWKLGRDKIAELDGGEIEYFRSFNGRTTLNKETGAITITGLTEEDTGTYFADINGQQFTTGQKLEVIRGVTKPNVSFTCEESSCVLSCKGASTTLGKYAWGVGDGEEEAHPSKEWTVQRSDKLVGKEFTCNYSNPVSHALSDPITPFKPDTPIGIIVGIVIGLLIVGLIALGVWQREKLQGWIQKKTKTDPTHTPEGNGPEAVSAPLNNPTTTDNTENEGGANAGPVESIPLNNENLPGN